MTQSEIDDTMKRVARELGNMSEAQKKTVTRNEESFGNWLRGRIHSIARDLGYIISFPFRAIADFFRGFWEGLTGR
jgi:D-mannonate dehydratase